MSSQTQPPSSSSTVTPEIATIKRHIHLYQVLHGQRSAEYFVLRCSSSQHHPAAFAYVLNGQRIPRDYVSIAVRCAYLQRAMRNDEYNMQVLEQKWKDLAWAEMERVDAEMRENERRMEEVMNRNMTERAMSRGMGHSLGDGGKMKGGQGGRAAGSA